MNVKYYLKKFHKSLTRREFSIPVNYSNTRRVMPFCLHTFIYILPLSPLLLPFSCSVVLAQLFQILLFKAGVSTSVNKLNMACHFHNIRSDYWKFLYELQTRM